MGIGTNISTQNIQQLEFFSGLAVPSALENYYPTLMIFILHSILIKETKVKIKNILNLKKISVKLTETDPRKAKTNLIHHAHNSNIALQKRCFICPKRRSSRGQKKRPIKK